MEGNPRRSYSLQKRGGRREYLGGIKFEEKSLSAETRRTQREP